MKMKNTFKLIIAIVVSELAGIIGSVFTTPSIAGWCAGIVKPALNPPAWVFGPVWTTLFALMGIAAFLVGSILCGFAWSMISLVVFRVIQGLGAGAVMPVAQTLLEGGP